MEYAKEIKEIFPTAITGINCQAGYYDTIEMYLPDGTALIIEGQGLSIFHDTEKRSTETEPNDKGERTRTVIAYGGMGNSKSTHT